MFAPQDPSPRESLIYAAHGSTGVVQQRIGVVMTCGLVRQSQKHSWTPRVLVVHGLLIHGSTQQSLGKATTFQQSTVVVLEP